MSSTFHGSLFDAMTRRRSVGRWGDGRPRLQPLARPDVPVEQQGTVWFGLMSHLGAPVLFVASLLVFGFTTTTTLVAFVAIAIANLALVLASELWAPSVELAVPRAEEVREGLALVFLTGFVGGGLVVVTGWFGLNYLGQWFARTPGQSWYAIAAVVLFTDYVYYASHRFLNHGRGTGRIMRWFRRNHATHHAVPELDFLRGNVSSFFDTAVTGFQVPLVVLSAVFGLDLTATLVAYGLVLMLQGTHHVNHTYNLGLFRYVFMDNHAHKLHHCPRGRLVNHGALFSMWDRIHGTYFEDPTLSSNYMAKHRIPIPVRWER